jgi:hypothetical protein
VVRAILLKEAERERFIDAMDAGEERRVTALAGRA